MGGVVGVLWGVGAGLGGVLGCVGGLAAPFRVARAANGILDLSTTATNQKHHNKFGAMPGPSSASFLQAVERATGRLSSGPTSPRGPLAQSRGVLEHNQEQSKQSWEILRACV